MTSRTADLELAATSFPRAFDAVESCAVADFAPAELPWPASAAAVTEALADWSITDAGSTLGPARESAAVIAAERRIARPGRATSIVLLTDAAPREDEACASSDWDAVETIARATMNTPSSSIARWVAWPR